MKKNKELLIKKELRDLSGLKRIIEDVIIEEENFSGKEWKFALNEEQRVLVGRYSLENLNNSKAYQRISEIQKILRSKNYKKL